MGLELEGRIIVINDKQQISASFAKREFVIETEESYPQKVAFELTQDKTSVIDAYKVGDKVKVHFNVRGREWNGKYFVNLNAWRLEGAAANSSSHAPAYSDIPPPIEPKEIQNSADDDLPF